MESGNVFSVLALLAAAVVIVILLLRVMHARQSRADRPAASPVATPPPAMSGEDQEYLDSSHISGPLGPGGDVHSDAAARAAAALRNAKRN